MTNSSVAKKLRIKPGHRVLVLNPPEGYVDRLTTELEGGRIELEPGGKYDFVQIFAPNAEQLDELIEVAQRSVIFDGLLWVSYPKGSSGVETDINRDSIWERLKSRGIRPVMQISIDDTWSAIRFRPKDQVGKK
jgi:hypothetical protein